MVQRIHFVKESEVRTFLESLGFSKYVAKDVARKVDLPIDILVAESDEETFKLNPNDHCDASLVSVTQGYEVLAGEIELVDREAVFVSCGPSTYRLIIPIAKLKPGTIVYNYVYGYTGDRREDSFELIVKPPKR